MPVPVSVVIPTYNRRDLVVETLRTIQGQTVPPAEIIIIDDGSTDDTEAAVAALDDPRIRYRRVVNGGDLSARNIGTRDAVSRYVAYCDSDDLWKPTFLETVTELLTRRPELRVIYTNFSIVRDSTWQPGSKFGDAPAGYWDGLERLDDRFGVLHGSFVDRLVRFQCFFPSSMLVDREDFLSHGGWDESVGRTVGSDFATALAVADRGEVGVVFESLAGVRKHRQNFSANVEAMNLGDARILEHFLQSRPHLASVEPLIRQSIARRRQDALALAFSRRDFAKVRQIARLVGPDDWRSAAKVAIAYALAPLERTGLVRQAAR